MRHMGIFAIALLLLTGCVQQKMVNPQDENFGILAVPIQHINKTSTGKFLYSYSLLSSGTENIRIPLTKNLNGFVFKKMKAGKYTLNALQMKSGHQMGWELSTVGRSGKFDPPIPFTIYPGQVTLFNAEFVFRITGAELGYFTTRLNINPLDTLTEIDEYKTKLRKEESYENAVIR